MLGDYIEDTRTSERYYNEVRELDRLYDDYRNRGGTLSCNEFVKVREYQRTGVDKGFASRFVNAWKDQTNGPETPSHVKRTIAQIHGSIGTEVNLNDLIVPQQPAWLVREGYLIAQEDPSAQMEARARSFLR